MTFDIIQFKSNGMKILYTGHVVNTARESVFLASYFYTYEGIREVFIHNINKPAQIAIPVIGGLSGGISWFVSFPLDSKNKRIKRREAIMGNKRDERLALRCNTYFDSGFLGK